MKLKEVTYSRTFSIGKYKSVRYEVKADVEVQEGQRQSAAAQEDLTNLKRLVDKTFAAHHPDGEIYD